MQRQYLVEKETKRKVAAGGEGMIERMGDANAHLYRGVTYFIKRSRYTDVSDIGEMGRTRTCVRYVWRKEGDRLAGTYASLRNIAQKNVSSR